MARCRIIKRLQDNLILSKTNAYKEIYTTKKKFIEKYLNINLFLLDANNWNINRD